MTRVWLSSSVRNDVIIGTTLPPYLSIDMPSHVFELRTDGRAKFVIVDCVADEKFGSEYHT